jgi:hypothetical protein
MQRRWNTLHHQEGMRSMGFIQAAEYDLQKIAVTTGPVVGNRMN